MSDLDLSDFEDDWEANRNRPYTILGDRDKDIYHNWYNWQHVMRKIKNVYIKLKIAKLAINLKMSGYIIDDILLKKQLGDKDET